MIHHTIHGDDVPALGLGTWKLDGDACREGVRHALEIGYRHIDTAQAYENEDEVGAGLAEADVDRDDVFLTTKLWFSNLKPSDMRTSAEESLRKLKTDYVDLLLVHWPHDTFEMPDTLDTLAELKDEGKTRHIGVSNFPPDLLETALEHAPIACNQVEYHPYLAQNQLLRLARSEDVLLTAYCPLARGKVLEDDLLQAIGEAHDKSPAQVALRWLVQQENVAAIPKASSAEHREANVGIFDFRLSSDEMAGIFDLARGERLIDPDFAPEAWNG